MFFLVWLCICINSYSSWQKKLSIMLYLEAYICVPLKRQRTNSLWILFFSFSIRSCNNLYFHFLFLDLLFLWLQKLEWESLSIDLLPHPDMFTEAHIASSLDGSTRKDDDGAKRRFFGGERFIEGISGEAYVITAFHL